MRVKRLAGGLWSLDVRYFHEGKEYRRRETVKGTETEAGARWQQLYQGMKRDVRSLKVRRGTFANAVDYYLASRQLDHGSETYLRTLQKDIGRTRIEDMREAWLDYLPLLRARRSANTGEPISAATVNLYYRWCKAAIGVVLRPGEFNPLARIPQLRVNPRDRVLTQDETRRLLQATQNTAAWLMPLVQFILAVPCRRGELLAMRRSWVDLFTWTVNIPSGITKNKLPCSKPIPPELRGFFRDLKDEHVFSNSEGRPLRLFPYSTWTRILAAAKPHDFRLHDTRHQAVTALANSGIPTPSIKAVAGWKTDMMHVYYHVDPHHSAVEIAKKWSEGDRTLAPDTGGMGGFQVASA